MKGDIPVKIRRMTAERKIKHHESSWVKVPLLIKLLYRIEIPRVKKKQAPIRCKRPSLEWGPLIKLPEEYSVHNAKS